MNYEKKLKIIIPLIIFSISLIVRLHNIQNSAVFVGDQEYQSSYAMTLVSDFHPIWIGVSAAHTGFYLGPLWTYFTAFWLWISSGDPLITNYISIIIGAIVSLSIYFVVLNIFKKQKLAIISSFLYVFSPLIIYYDRVYWNPTPLPFLTIVLFYSLYKAVNKAYSWWVIFFVAFALVFHTHLSIVLLGFIGIYFLLKNIKVIKFKYILASLISFIVIYSPLIIFDINHNWSNLKSPFKFTSLIGRQTSLINPTHHLNAFLETLGRVWFLKPGSNESDEVLFDCGSSAKMVTNSKFLKYSERTNNRYFYAIPLLISIIYFLIDKRTWSNRSWKLLAIFFLTIVFSFLFFPGGAFEYYLLGLFPLICIIFANFVNQKNKFLRFILSLFVVAISVRGFWVVMKAKSDFGIGAKKEIINRVTFALGNKSFELFQDGDCHTFEGWRYLYKIYGKVPSRSSSDVNFGWLYPDEISTDKVDFKVIMHERRVPWLSEEAPYKRIDYAGFSAFIYN